MASSAGADGGLGHEVSIDRNASTLPTSGVVASIRALSRLPMIRGAARRGAWRAAAAAVFADPAAGMSEDEAFAARARAAMRGPEIDITVVLGEGHGTSRVLGCDLSYDYVRINGEYTT